MLLRARLSTGESPNTRLVAHGLVGRAGEIRGERNQRRETWKHHETPKVGRRTASFTNY